MNPRSIALFALAAAAAAACNVPALPVLAGEPRRDPFKPDTRYRRTASSPAERLLERQRRKRARQATVRSMPR